jgi:predicted ATPase
MENKKTQTNWYVITGGPSTGKTTTVNLLRSKGYKTTIEHARHYIDTQLIKGKTVAAMRQNQQSFQAGILDMQIEQESLLSAEEMVFLDRAIPDALAYYRFLDLSEDEKLLQAMSSVSYRKIFILDRLPLIKDYARIEDEETQKKIHEFIIEVYQSLPFPIITVPVLDPEERVLYILNNIK